MVFKIDSMLIGNERKWHFRSQRNPGMVQATNCQSVREIVILYDLESGGICTAM